MRRGDGLAGLARPTSTTAHYPTSCDLMLLPHARPAIYSKHAHTHIHTGEAAFHRVREPGAAVAAARAEGTGLRLPSPRLPSPLFRLRLPPLLASSPFLLATLVMAAAANSVMDVEEAVEDAAVVLLENKVPSMSMLNEKEVGREGGREEGREGGK